MAKKLTIEFVRNQIENVLHPGSKLISNEYINSTTKLNCHCENNHIFEISWRDISQGNWCQKCSIERSSDKRRLGYNYIKDQIENILHKGSKLLSIEYINTHKKLIIRCKNNHIFKMKWGHLQSGHWCPDCSGNKRLNYDFLKDQIENVLHKGSKLLNTEYVNTSTKFEIICENGHKFVTDWRRISSNKWCPDCSGNKRLTYDFVKDQIENVLHKGSKLLNTEYVSTKTKLDVLCEKGHRFNSLWHNIIKGHWCPKCFGNQILTYNFIKDQIENILHKGSKLLSTEYENNNTKLEIICEKGHRFGITWGNLSNNKWCDECSSLKGERITRLFFKTIFNAEFPKSRPRWLKSKDGYSLELDGFNNDLKIAFEHQGLQHYKNSGWFVPSKKVFDKIQENDQIKIDECNKRNIALICVPDVLNIIKLKDLKDYVKKEFQKLDRFHLLPPNYDEIEIDFSKIYREYISELEYIKNQIENLLHKGSILISNEYISNKTKLDILCENGHKIKKTWDSIKSGSWCPICAGNIKHTYNYIKDQIENVLHRGSKLLSNEYINSRTPLRIQCDKGHLSEMNWGNIQSGQWCLDCSGKKRLTLVFIKKQVEDILHKGSRLLSNEYINSRTPLKLQCKNGHTFDMSWDYIKQKRWCKKCK